MDLQEVTHVPYTEPKQRWLREELGLQFDPFEYLDAGADPHLPEYLIDHGAFEVLWGDWPSFLFAPPGGGKTAFRVRLMRACRVGQERREVFPILFRPPRPAEEDVPPDEKEFFRALLQEAGAGLLFQLAYQPYRFLELPHFSRQQVRQTLEETLPAPLRYYLLQMEEAGSLEPLAQAFDPTARGLPAEPLPATIRSFCKALSGNGHVPATQVSPVLPSDQRFFSFVQRLFQTLRYESVYLLIDGADAYTQDPPWIVRLLEPLLARMNELMQRKIFPKFFLPDDVASLLEQNGRSLLTEPTKMAIIQWDRDSLVAIVRDRLYIASEGMYGGLEAISSRDAPRPAEEYLAEFVTPPVPREMLLLVGRVFTEHILRVGPYGRLEGRDFEAAVRWYRGRDRVYPCSLREPPPE